MSDAGAVPKCSQCGYPLVGMPPPRRCPECGARPVHRARWIEGELHLEGPRAVWPVFLRCTAAASLLVLVALAALLVPDPVVQKAIPGRHGVLHLLASMLTRSGPLPFDPLWIVVARDGAAVLAAFLWTRPIELPGTDAFGVQRGSRWRRWVMPMQLPLLVHAGLLMAQVQAVSKGQVISVGLVQATGALAMAACVGWLAAMRHTLRVAEYLRERVVSRSVVTCTWGWCVATVVLAAFGIVSARYDAWPGLDGSLFVMERMLSVIILWATVNACLLAWATANSLTMSYENAASEQRRAEREASRYRTPE